MKTIKKFLTVFILLSLFLASTPIQSAHAAGVRYAKPTASGTGDCFGWENACTLQTALTGASSGDQIWVAAGTHTPHASDRAVSFTLKNGVAIYGGFAGTESLLSERDYAVNLTILSGDLNGDDVGFANNGENSFHVLVGSVTDSTAALDGFTVTGGKANWTYPLNVGGGMYIGGGSPILRNLTFSRNSAVYGAGLFNENNSSPTLTNVTFSSNQATHGGGGMYNWENSSPTVTNVTFSGNAASGGGGMFNNNSSPTLTNVTFSGNSASDSGGMNAQSSPTDTDTNFIFSTNLTSGGGGMFNNNTSSPTLTNVIIANSLSGGDCVNDVLITLNAASSNNLIEDSANACGLTNGSDGNIIGQDPDLGPLTGAPAYFPLLSSSPAIDAGMNTGCPATDQRGVQRPQGASCDIGAYEVEIYTTTFPDVPTDFWAWTFIERLSNAGITSGFPDGTYRPGDPVTRGQMAVFLLKAMNYPTSYTPPSTSATFPDTTNHWAEDWIEALKETGITGGFPDGTYRPGAPVTRAQMAIFLLKAINGPGYEPPPAPPTFDDTAEHWGSDWIEALRAAGLTGGYPDGTYRPENPVTRAEMAVFIVNTFGLP